MSYDLNRCPQTEAEFTEYFYALIGRTIDGNANDWAAVLSRPYAWQGRLLTIPPGVGPGIKQPPDAPFFGLTQQWSGGPKARIFLPTNQPDGNGYYTRNIQYIKDTPGGVHGQDFTWTWWYQDGQAYSPVLPAEPVPPDTNPPTVPCNCEQNTADINDLKAIVQQQHDQIAALAAQTLSEEQVKALLRACKVRVTVGRSWGHDHTASGEIVP